jgi:hypothetical protein
MDLARRVLHRLAVTCYRLIQTLCHGSCCIDLMIMPCRSAPNSNGWTARPSVEASLQQVARRKRAAQTRVSSSQILKSRDADRR